MRIEDADAIDDYHRAPAPLMTVEEFNALAGRTIKIADGLNENPVQLMCAAYRRAISEVERVTKEQDAAETALSEQGARGEWWSVPSEATHYVKVAISDVMFRYARNRRTPLQQALIRIAEQFSDRLDRERSAVRGDAAIREEAPWDWTKDFTHSPFPMEPPAPVQPPREDAPRPLVPERSKEWWMTKAKAEEGMISAGFPDSVIDPSWECPQPNCYGDASTPCMHYVHPVQPPADREPPR